jgi:hypothetical protein
LNTKDDPGGVKARNALALAYNERVNQFGSIFGLKDNPKLSAAQAAYTQFMNDVAAQETHRAAQGEDKVGVGAQGYSVNYTNKSSPLGPLGQLSNESFMPALKTYLGTQGLRLSRDVDFALASKYRVADSAVHSANLVHFGSDALGSENNPITVNNMEEYNKIPNGMVVFDPKTNTKVMKGTPGIIH